jgi:hypothetical protein
MEQTTTDLTFGQKAVGLKFNHAVGVTGDRVHKAKMLCAELIDLVEEDNTEKEEKGLKTWCKNVFRTAAFNGIIAAQMAVVKFLTWQE